MEYNKNQVESVVADFLAYCAKEWNDAKTDKQKDKKYDAMFTTMIIAGKLGLKCETCHGSHGYEYIKVGDIRKEIA